MPSAPFAGTLCCLGRPRVTCKWLDVNGAVMAAAGSGLAEKGVVIDAYHKGNLMRSASLQRFRCVDTSKRSAKMPLTDCHESRHQLRFYQLQLQAKLQLQERSSDERASGQAWQTRMRTKAYGLKDPGMKFDKRCMSMFDSAEANGSSREIDRR